MRKEGWEKRLDEYIHSVGQKTFNWGKCDCLLFVSDACVITCGKDPMSKKFETDPETIRDQYSSEEEARDLIKQYRKSIPDIMDVHFERIDPAFAQRGDVVLAKIQGHTFGLIWGGKAFFKTDTEGFHTLSVKECRHAWRVE